MADAKRMSSQLPWGSVLLVFLLTLSTKTAKVCGSIRCVLSLSLFPLASKPLFEVVGVLFVAASPCQPPRASKQDLLFFAWSLFILHLQNNCEP